MRRSRAFVPVTSRRWLTRSCRCWRCARRRDWCRWAWSRSTAACWPGMPRQRRRAATPRSARRSSRCLPRPLGRTPRRMGVSAPRAAMSCRPSSSIRARGGSGCAAARSSLSGSRPTIRRPTRRISLGEPPGRPSTGGGWGVASRRRPTRLRSLRGRSTRPIQVDDQAAYEANLAWRAAWEAEHGRRLGGRKPTPPDPAALAARKINTTDPDTRLVKRAGGRSVQGYNAQVVASPEQVIIAAQVTQSHNDADQLAPMVARAADTLREAGIQEPVGIVLADGGYWNSPAIANVREQGIDVLIPTRDRRRTTPRKLSPRQGDEAQRIEAVLATPEGQTLYRKRQQIVEPVFAHTKCIRRTDRFLRRGLAACQAEWQLIAGTHNLLKLWRASLAHAGTAIPEPLAG